MISDWGEAYHQGIRRFGDQKAQEIEQLIHTLPITLIEANKSWLDRFVAFWSMEGRAEPGSVMVVSVQNRPRKAQASFLKQLP